MPRAYIRTNDNFDGPIFGGWGVGQDAYIWEEKQFNLQSVKLVKLLLFFLFSSIKLIFCHIHVSAICKIRSSKLPIKTPEYLKLTKNSRIK